MEFSYRCTECDRTYPITPDRMLCDECARERTENEPLRGLLEVVLEGTLTVTDPGRLPVGELLPVEPEHIPGIPVGNTPLWAPARLREELEAPGLFLKDDTANPTGSLKDRASLLVAAMALKHGISDITVASTGNAASSMSGIGAATGLNIKVFVPRDVPRGKLVQCLQYGADVTVVDGTYDNAYLESTLHTKKHGGMSRNTAFNPMTIEGKKTVALEIFSQLGFVPDAVFVPTGDGVIAGGVYKGFEDLVTVGVANRVPTIYVVQAEGSNAICRAMETGSFAEPVSGETLADSISVSIPANGHGLLRKLKHHDGRGVVVTDDEILDAQHMLSSRAGLFPEPAAAASLAGFLRVRQTLPPDAVSVLLVTGTGLKDLDTASRRVELPL